MKLQMFEQRLRLRIDERELAELLAGETLQLHLHRDGAALFALRVRLDDAARLDNGETWELRLPDADLRGYADTLPRREALSLPLVGGLTLDVEVDVRDSIRRRGPRPRER